MTALELIAVGTVYGFAGTATAYTAGLVLNRTAAVEQSWADGRQWLADRRADAATAVATAHGALTAVGQHAARTTIGLLIAARCTVLPPRREVA